ncbi:MAG: DUF192 domain-containing protein [Emcibacteraceae bacterium]|nr:DUF192 domain-containing protein [Emcibacteraceae bacterium]
MIMKSNSKLFAINYFNYLKFFLFSLFLSLVFVLCLTAVTQAQEKFPQGELSIKTTTHSYDFEIELALDDSHRQYGLMFRDSLAEMSGMLFVYDRKRNLSMWMKNTFIPLDIIFIDNQGKIINIAKSTQPRSLSIIRSKKAAKAVLELNGGLTDKLEIAVGDEIIHATFKNLNK